MAVFQVVHPCEIEPPGEPEHERRIVVERDFVLLKISHRVRVVVPLSGAAHQGAENSVGWPSLHRLVRAVVWVPWRVGQIVGYIRSATRVAAQGVVNYEVAPFEEIVESKLLVGQIADACFG